MEGLNLDNVLSETEINNLFLDNKENEENQGTPPEETKKGEENIENNNSETTEVNAETLFGRTPESVGSGNTGSQESTNSNKGNSTSPNNFYSSVASALKEEGTFPDLDDETITKIKTAEDFRNLIDNQIKSGLEEKQKRVAEALEAGVETNVIKQYEGTLSYLDGLSESALKVESNEGEDLRKNLIYQDYINKGFSKERAKREVERSLNNGTDIDDALEALKSNKEFYKAQYDKLIKDAQAEEDKYKESQKAEAENLRKSIMEDEKVYGEINVDKTTRQKIFDNIVKPVYKDPKTGEYYTAIQKYEMDNRVEFMKNLGLVFTLTDGFKNLNGLIQGKVKKEVSKGLRNLENVINNTARTTDGNLKFASGADSDPESFWKGIKLDI